MISGKNRNCHAIELRNVPALPSGQPDRDFFQPAKAPQRFRQHLLPCKGCVRHLAVGVWQGATEGLDVA